MRSEEIRQRFLRFFDSRGHTVVPSSSLLVDDPNLLFVGAGMVPFKPYLLGQVTPAYPRATSVQKCVRTQDIENVGVTTRHNTFFQMAGNFAFGDYFKEGAITAAWELVTGSPVDGGFGLDPERLWVTVYQDDDEAVGLWREIADLPDERIQRRGMLDNYWSMDVPGPCGPCSEIYYDRGAAYGPDGGPVVDEERFLEFWNLVFMQYERGPSTGPGKTDYEILGPLPAQNIDTGLGMERLAALLQGVDNVYETDLLRGVLDRAGALAGVRYGADAVADVRLRVVADHTRTATMLIADGVVPSNEGRGYVLRRLVRRVVRNMRLLGYDKPAMPELVPMVRDAMGPSYPELVSDYERIAGYAAGEEESFLATLRTGTTIFDTAVAETRRRGGAALSDERAFTLHDTFGFPIELTLEMAAEAGLSVDEEGFRRLMAEQRDRARLDARARKTGHADVSAYRELLEAAGPPQFTGYTEVRTETRLRGLLRGGASVPVAREGDEVEVVLDRTPFYAEAGGQLADEGRIRLADGAELVVFDVQRPIADLPVHRARVITGEVSVGAEVLAEVDVERRRSISRSHTATHLVHSAVRRALGESATQAGSLNAPGRLRFDFSSPAAVPPAVLADVEDEVNAVLIDDLAVRAFVTSQAEARRLGAIALFGEKYGDAVRVVEVGDYARELCGGTHAARSAQLGLVKLLGEASIGAGVRRVEGLVGLDAFRFLAREHVLVAELAETFKVPGEEVAERVQATVARLREAERELERLRAGALLATAADLAAGPVEVAGAAVVAHRAPDGTGTDGLRRLALDVRGRIESTRPAVVALVAVSGDKPAVVIAVNDAGRARGLSASALVREVAPVLGGRGGGKDDFAAGGGSDPAAVGEALELVPRLVGERLSAG
jgi:alanyl-tRNA synthetase